jgi:hypothetical protein
MSVVVVGGDHLGGIKDKLVEMGATELVHVHGRKKSDARKVSLSGRTSLVLILTDYVNHDIMARVKDEAKAMRIPLVYARRSWTSIETKMKEGGWMQ